MWSRTALLFATAGGLVACGQPGPQEPARESRHDASSEAAVGGPNWCATRTEHTLCEDFDLGPIDRAKWGDVVEKGGMSLLRESVATSAPSALTLRYEKPLVNVGGDPPIAGVGRFYNVRAKSVTFEVDVMCEDFTYDADGRTDLAWAGGLMLSSTFVTLDYARMGPGVRITMPATERTVDVPEEAYAPVKLTLGRWAHVKISIRFASTPTGSVDVWIDGALVWSVKDKITGGAFGVGAGVWLSGSMPRAATVRYDNVLFDIEGVDDPHERLRRKAPPR